MREEVTKFIEAYRGSFSRGPRTIAEFYSEPCVTAGVGVVRVNATRKDTERLFVEVDAEYRARGFTHIDILALDIQPLGSNSALATVQWVYKEACEEVLGKPRSPTTCTGAMVPGRSWFKHFMTRETSPR